MGCRNHGLPGVAKETASLTDSLLPGAQQWNQAITRKNNLFLTAGRRLLPSVEVHYYSFGGLIRGPDGDGWGPSGDWFTMDEQTDVFGVSLYSVPEIGYTRSAYNRTATAAVARGESRHTHNASTATAVPWISLGCGCEGPCSTISCLSRAHARSLSRIVAKVRRRFLIYFVRPGLRRRSAPV